MSGTSTLEVAHQAAGIASILNANPLLAASWAYPGGTDYPLVEVWRIGRDAVRLQATPDGWDLGDSGPYSYQQWTATMLAEVATRHLLGVRADTLVADDQIATGMQLTVQMVSQRGGWIRTYCVNDQGEFCGPVDWLPHEKVLLTNRVG